MTLCTTRKALILLFLRKAELVNENSKLRVRSANSSYPWPSVIRLKSYISLPYKNINLTRKNILRRDNHKCAYCGRGDLTFTLDHVIPKSKGGRDTWENLVTACLPCNNKKSDLNLEQAGLKLRIIPYKPNYIMFILNSVSRIDDNWRTYLYQ